MTERFKEKVKQLKEGEMIKLSDPEAFKMMYGDPDNIDILTAFIAPILGVNYEDIKGKVTLKTPYNENEESDNKLEVRVEDTRPIRLVINLNMRNNKEKKDKEAKDLKKKSKLSNLKDVEE